LEKKRSFLNKGLLFLGILFVFFFISSIVIVAVSKKDQYGGSKIAIVRVQGVITSSKAVLEEMDKYRKNPTVKGIVLRVNTVGGGVAPSQEIREAVKRMQRAGKKVVVSMGSVAASGGYYISCGADKIFANPGTLTGSIGVIMEFPNVQELMKTVGVRSSVIKSGKFKDIGSPVRPMTTEEKAILQGVIDDVYDQFISTISEDRHMKKSDVRALADGRIFSGRKAKELGLVDEIGSIQKSIEAAAKLCNVGDYEVLEKKKKSGILQLLNGVFGGSLFSARSLPSLCFRGIEFRWSP